LCSGGSLSNLLAAIAADAAIVLKSIGIPDWEYMPPNDEGHPFEWKPSDWGMLKGRLVALDYAAPALFEAAP